MMRSSPTRYTLIVGLILACTGCASEWRCVLHGEQFLLTGGEPTYKRLNVTLVSVEPDGSATVRWNKSGHVSKVSIDQAATGGEGDEGFVRLLASRPDRRLAVFDTTWSTR